MGIWFAVAGAAASPMLIGAAVATFLAAAVAHAIVWRGLRFTVAWLLTSLVLTFTVEVAGVALGAPFGTYVYSDGLGPKALGVPVLVPIAWTMMVYPAQVVGWRCAKRRAASLAVAVLALATWDLQLDPVMVRAGMWTWREPGLAWFGIPLTNFVGWGATATGLFLLLRPFWPPASPERDAIDDFVPLGLYAGMSGCLLARNVLGGDLVPGVVGGVLAAVLIRGALVARQQPARRTQREFQRVP